MKCAEFVELVTEYIEAALAQTERLRVEAHLNGCRGCQAYLDQMQRTIGMLGRLADGDAAATTQREELLDTFRAWKEGSLERGR